MIQFGKKYRDKETGIEGIATAITEYEFGCRRVLLERLGKDEHGNVIILEFTFDEQRLVAKGKAKAKKGGPGSTLLGRNLPQKR